jgi:hypothetical protein
MWSRFVPLLKFERKSKMIATLRHCASTAVMVPSSGFALVDSVLLADEPLVVAGIAAHEADTQPNMHTVTTVSVAFYCD